MSKSRAIRFSIPEEKLIEEFLQNNPFFDFSTLGRIAILDFIKNPKMTIKPVKTEITGTVNRRQNANSQ